jgi:heme/copper-type cytochrome/quinol oxidase subunit 4
VTRGLPKNILEYYMGIIFYFTIKYTIALNLSVNMRISTLRLIAYGFAPRPCLLQTNAVMNVVCDEQIILALVMHLHLPTTLPQPGWARRGYESGPQ